MVPLPTPWVLPAFLVATLAAAMAAEPENAAPGERLEVQRNGSVVMVLQRGPLAGGKPAGSGFIGSLRTPSGFEIATVQPADHPHHFGIWWPWKFIDVGGKSYNSWEIQQGQARRVVRDVRKLPAGAGAWEMLSETEILEAGKPPEAVIRESATITFHPEAPDAHALDIAIAQAPVSRPVTVAAYRYSGFAWRGPATWTASNSRMLTSGGFGRDNANGTPARWIVVTGPTPAGIASVLILSAAAVQAGGEERLRVWDSKNQSGTPFVNFNPVQNHPLALEPDHPAVSSRHYRVVAADHAITAEEAETAWKNWTAGKTRKPI